MPSPVDDTHESGVGDDAENDIDNSLDNDLNGFDNEFEDDASDVADAIESEPPLSDARHDRIVVLLAVMICVGALALFTGLNLLQPTGLFGQDCGLNHLRSAQCYQPGSEVRSWYEQGQATSTPPWQLVIPTTTP